MQPQKESVAYRELSCQLSEVSESEKEESANAQDHAVIRMRRCKTN